MTHGIKTITVAEPPPLALVLAEPIEGFRATVNVAGLTKTEVEAMDWSDVAKAMAALACRLLNDSGGGGGGGGGGGTGAGCTKITLTEKDGSTLTIEKCPGAVA